MCRMNFISFPGCGHTDYNFPKSGYCNIGFDSEQQTCCTGANELGSVSQGRYVSQFCDSCYEAELTNIRAAHMERWNKVVEEAGEQGLSKRDVKGDLDRIMKEMMKAATEWKIECGAKEDGMVKPDEY